jgi:hypothetical protein
MDRRYEILVFRLVVGVLLAGGLFSRAHAEPPAVHFDVVPVVGCQDVTSPEFAAVNPHERLFEARFQISSLIVRGDEQDLVQYLYRIESLQHGFVVVDYLPQTTLTTDVVEHVSVERQREDTRSLGITASGQYEHLAKGTATVGGGRTIKSSVRYELLPPLELLAASGTVSRGSGVYFKLRPSRRSSLEGAQEFVLVLRVPRSWRGDLVRIQCQAVGKKPSVLPGVEGEFVWGEADVSVGLYAAGDLAAKQTATSLMTADREMRETVARAHREIRKLAVPSMSLKLGRLPKVTQPRLSLADVDRFMAQPDQVSLRGGQKYLPVDVREAVTAYACAKGRLRNLNGHETVLARSSGGVAAE